jgi:hypothetical protein
LQMGRSIHFGFRQHVGLLHVSCGLSRDNAPRG